MHDIHSVSRAFQIFAGRECKGGSNLYYQLPHEISEEKDSLKLARKCRERQAIPNLFHGALHYLILTYRL